MPHLQLCGDSLSGVWNSIFGYASIRTSWSCQVELSHQQPQQQRGQSQSLLPREE